jgi:hypothetical protein
MIERSFAIKAPKIEYHLMCTKKFQQYLSKPGVLEKFVSEKNVLDSIRGTFFEQYSFAEVSLYQNSFASLFLFICIDFLKE